MVQDNIGHGEGLDRDDAFAVAHPGYQAQACDEQAMDLAVKFNWGKLGS